MPIIFAGIPAAISPAGTLSSNTAPAPTIAFSTTVTPPRIIAWLVILACFFIRGVGQRDKKWGEWTKQDKSVKVK